MPPMELLTAGAQTGDLQVNRALVRQRTKINEVVAAINAPLVTGAGIAKITVGPTAPTNPQVGDIWVDTSA